MEFKFIPLIIIALVAIGGITAIGITGCQELKKIKSSNEQTLSDIGTPTFIKKSDRINELHHIYKELKRMDKSPSPRPTTAEIIGLKIEILKAIQNEVQFTQ